jgi:hypothetical protein
MAFVMTRPSSPLPREATSQIASDSSSYPQTPALSNLDMGKDKDCKPHLDIQLDSPSIYLKGVGVDVEPALLSGHVALYLTESTSIKEITLQFRGKARMPSSDPYVPCFVAKICSYSPPFVQHHPGQCSSDIHCLHARLVILRRRKAPQPYTQGRSSSLPLPTSYWGFSALEHVDLGAWGRVCRVQTAC